MKNKVIIEISKEKIIYKIYVNDKLILKTDNKDIFDYTKKIYNVKY